MLEKRYFKAQLCDSNLSYEFFPNPPLTLTLVDLAEELHDAGVIFDIKTAFVLVFKIDGARVSLYPSGKILVKNISVYTQAQKVFARVLEKMNACPTIQQI